jgi:predicted DNA-binding transcriptional regulator AlpA
MEARHAAKITRFEDVTANGEAALWRLLLNNKFPFPFMMGDFECQFYLSGIFTENVALNLTMVLQSLVMELASE